MVFNTDSARKYGKLGLPSFKLYCEHKKIKSREEYNKNPKLCKGCGAPMCYEKRRNIFCNQSCAAVFNNKGVSRIRLTHNCKHCGKKIHWKYKFCSKECRNLYKSNEYIEMVQSKMIRHEPIAHTSIRKYLLMTRKYICEKCKLKIWNDLPIPLEIHHIDGNYRNNIESNLELLCNNCHSQTDNYRIKNKGNGRPYRIFKST